MKILSNDDDASKIFSDVPQIIVEEKPLNIGVSGAFSDVPRGSPKNKYVEVDCTESFAVPDVPLKELKAMFPAEWNTFRCVRYQRCGVGGGYELHPSISTFPRFLGAFGPRPGPDFTLDRLDPNDPMYAPGLCRWGSKLQQSENRRNVVYLTDNAGKCFSVPEWCRRSGIPIKTLHRRLKLGWTHHDAVHTKVGKRAINSTADPEYTYAPPNPPPIYHPLLTVFQAALRQHHAAPFFVAEPKHVRLVKDIARLIEEGGLPPDKVLSCVLGNWGDKHYKGFAKYVSGHATMPVPEIPTLEFMRRHLSAMGNFYLKQEGQLQYFGVVSAAELHEIHKPPDFVPADTVIMLRKNL